MLKIGEFSKLSRISVRMLRHYDEIGLLKPAEIDRFTDYRYYREDQLPTAGRIAALKDMGFSLADIVRILAVYDDREQMERFFSARQEELRTIYHQVKPQLNNAQVEEYNRLKGRFTKRMMAYHGDKIAEGVQLSADSIAKAASRAGKAIGGFFNGLFGNE